jgi:hypothetical protein
MPRQPMSEEDIEVKEPLVITFLKQFQNPSEDSLPANTCLPYTMTTPMAEMAVMEELRASMIEHQLNKAEIYCSELPENEQAAYHKRIEAFKDEHYLKNKEGQPDLKRPIFASTTLRKYIALYSLSIKGMHHDDTKDLSQSMIESMGVTENKEA